MMTWRMAQSTRIIAEIDVAMLPIEVALELCLETYCILQVRHAEFDSAELKS